MPKSTSAKSSKRAAELDRRQRAAEMRRQAKAKERKQTLIIVGVGVLVSLALIAAVAVPSLLSYRKDLSHKAFNKIGVPMASAGCSAIKDVKAGSKDRDHVGVGTDKDTITHVDYSTNPPAVGAHFVTPKIGAHFISRDDGTVAVETLVHNLEHGYTVVWYDKTVTDQAALDQLKALTKKIPVKLVVAPWDDSRGAFPKKAHIGLSAWGHVQTCASVSGEAINAFHKKYPASQAPEPDAA